MRLKLIYMAGLLNEKINKNFIVFEGIDGSGKGTQVELLKDYFLKKGRKDVVFTFEHTRDGQWSQNIEDIVSGKIKNISSEKVQLLYILDRKDHIHNFILPNLKKERKVFCDRYFLSTLAYGSLDGKTHWKTLWNYHKEIIGDEMIMPNKIFFFDVEPDLAISRIVQRDIKKTIFENRESLKKIREAYLSIGPHFDGFEVIDASGTPENVFNSLKSRLADYL